MDMSQNITNNKKTENKTKIRPLAACKAQLPIALCS